MTRDEIAAIVTTLGDLAQVIHDADPADKAELYTQFGLSMTYRPQERLVEATVTPSLHMCKGFVSEARGLPIAHGRIDQDFCSWWCPVMAADWVVRWTIAGAVVGIAAVAAWRPARLRTRLCSI
jgi:hypothetical protein